MKTTVFSHREIDEKEAFKRYFQCLLTGESQPLKVYGESIKQVQDFKYLGSMMASSSNDLKRQKALIGMDRLLETRASLA